MMREGSLVDGRMIEGGRCRKKKEEEGDGEMDERKKGNEWEFGMKGEIGVDGKSGVRERVVRRGGKEDEVNEVGNVVDGEEEFV